MRIKQKITVRVGGVDVNGTSTATDFISDAIRVGSKDWSLNSWFDAVVTGSPTFTVRGSNVTDADSFNPLGCATDKAAPDIIGYLAAEYKYIQIEYNANGATGGNKNFDLFLGDAL